ncbi:MAG TPA: DNA-directed RNA polymerase subunit alpha C-terminal domain-containing protein [Bacteroidia bacterium]|nr:DNA-directed RNA polymerase subunit alpha C-terminal domain-containing protein [Bacteroidia bacterium]
METTLQELKQLFKISSSRQIKAGLKNKIRMFDDGGIEVTDETLMQTLEKFRQGGVYEIKEVCERYNLSRQEVLYLIRAKRISGFKLLMSQGSKWLFLKEELEKENEVLLFHSSRRNPERLAKLAESLMRGLVQRGLMSEREVVLFSEYYFEGKTYGEIAGAFDLTTDNTRNKVERTGRRLLYKLSYFIACEKQMKEFEKKYLEQKALRKMLEQLIDPVKLIGSDYPHKETLVTPVSALTARLTNYDFGVRELTCFRHAEIETIGDLLAYGKERLMKVRNFGKKSLTSTEEVLHKLGFVLT